MPKLTQESRLSCRQCLPTKYSLRNDLSDFPKMIQEKKMLLVSAATHSPQLDGVHLLAQPIGKSLQMPPALMVSASFRPAHINGVCPSLSRVDRLAGQPVTGQWQHCHARLPNEEVAPHFLAKPVCIRQIRVFGDPGASKSSSVYS